MNKIFKIFIDFDGTITKKDVGANIFYEFGNPEFSDKSIKRLLNDEINSEENWNNLCVSVNNISEAELEDYLNSIEIDETFGRFEEYCRENHFEIFILSDGFDYYIERILAKEGFSHIKYFANKLIINNGKLIPSYPYKDEECSRCANCKKNHLINNSSDKEFTIYIGDGHSDRCPAEYADFIFAKNDLLRFCEIERITFNPFNSFTDIMTKLDELKMRRNLKKRYQAELKRKEIYMRG